MELGLGIHGEPGVERVPRQPADQVVERILSAIIQDQGLGSGSRVVLLVNGLGGTPPMELGIIARHALAVCRQAGLVIERAWSGNFLTALEMPGCSLSLMRVTDHRLGRLDAPTVAPAWPGGGVLAPVRDERPAPVSAPMDLPGVPADAVIRSVALAVAAALEAAEGELTRLDSLTGDGDLGVSLARGAAAIRALPDAAWSAPAVALSTVAMALRQAIGGSSGPFYATSLLRAATRLPGERLPAATDWAVALHAGVGAIAELGGAGPGDLTMLDALIPAATAFSDALRRGESPATSWAEAVAAADAGAAATRTMHPRLGRASYMGSRALGHVDAGAAAVAIWLRSIKF